MTDRAVSIFDANINLSIDNKTLAVGRVLREQPDVVLFADAALDSRVFALAHERLARWQIALWVSGWVGESVRAK